MNQNVRPMTKSDRLRRAAKFCWFAGLFFTFQMMMPITDSISEVVIQYVVAAVAAGFVQYVLSLIEGTILDGILPAPWQIDFRGHPQQSILAVFAYGAFMVDVFVNFGGIYAATGKLDMTATATAMHISPYMLAVLLFVIAFFLSALFALGSELLEALADMYEGKAQNRPKFQYANAPQEHRGAEQQSNKQRKADHELRARLLAQAAADAAAMKQAETVNALEPAGNQSVLKQRLDAARAQRRKGL